MVLQPDPAKSIQSSTIDCDLPCRQCGYNLRGLMGSGACPECGHAVAESARRNLLRDSDPTYAANIRAAAMLMIVGLILSAFASAVIPPTKVIEYLDDSSRVLAFLVIVGAIFVMSAGLWKMTSIDPAVFEDRRHERLRRLVRVTVVIGNVTQLFGLAIFSSLDDGSGLPPSMFELLPLWMLILADAIALITCVFATFEYLQMLSRRIPDQVLARGFELLRWGFGIPFSVLVLAAAGELSLQISTSAGVIDDQVIAANTDFWLMAAFAGLFYIAALVRLWRGAVTSIRSATV